MPIRPCREPIFIRLIAAVLVLGIVVFPAILARPAGAVAAVTPVSPLTLEPLIQMALARHPALAGARAAVAVRQARVGEAAAPYWPQVAVSSGLSQTTNVSQAQTTAQPFVLSQLGFTVRQQLYDFGKTAAEVDALAATGQASAYQARLQAVEVAFGVRRTYLEWVRAIALERQAVERLLSADRLLAVARGFWQAGRRPRIDVIRAEATRAQANAERLQAHYGVTLARSSLGAAVASADLPAGEPILPLEPAATRAPLSVQLERAAQTHPALAASRASETASQAQRQIADRAGWPDVVADVNYGLRARDDVPAQNWAAGVSVSAPLFTGFAQTHRSEAAEAQSAVASADVAVQTLQLRLAIERAHQQIAGARERLPAVEAAVRSARETLRLAEGRYRAGVGAVVELSDAQALVATAESDRVRAAVDLHLALAEDLRAMGLTGIE